jgi:hypothetical protein
VESIAGRRLPLKSKPLPVGDIANGFDDPHLSRVGIVPFPEAILRTPDLTRSFGPYGLPDKTSTPVSVQRMKAQQYNSRIRNPGSELSQLLPAYAGLAIIS